MLEKLKQEVLDANLLLYKHGLTTLTWGSVSGIDREKGLIVIKPSGVEYDAMKVEDMVVVALETGDRVEGQYAPSKDTITHLTLYRAFPTMGGVVHTRSRWATSFAQAGISIPVFGTTHSECFYGEIPCTRMMTLSETAGECGLETGKVIIDTLQSRQIDPAQVPAVLVNCHGPYTWGTNPHDAVHNAAVLEEIAFLAYHTAALNPRLLPMQLAMLNQHYMKKQDSDR